MRLALALALGLAAATGAATLASAQDYSVGSIRIEAPWIRATPTGAKVAGGYMMLQNTGKEPDRLVGGSFPLAGKLEVHEMRMDGSVMKMRALPKGLEVKPGQRVELKPGSYHIMLMDLRQPLKEGDKVKGTLTFEKAGNVEIEYAVRGVAGKSHGGMKH
jgi:copper(I)-binding protein